MVPFWPLPGQVTGTLFPLPTSVGGLIIHLAEHTQRRLGQAILTAKLVR